MTRLLHFADLHLDRSFAGLGMAVSEASKRREELRDALRRIVALAIELDVDALTVGGDLYEHERATADTGRFIAEEFQRLAPRPVLVAPGNHDPYLPDSLYRRTQWPPNVHIFTQPRWEQRRLDESLVVWGAGHVSPDLRDNLLAQLRVDRRDGVAVALLHASDISAVPENKQAHCPFTREDIENSGVAFALLGHYHELRLKPEGRPLFGYPGSPEPLSFGEPGHHYVLLLEADSAGVKVEPWAINQVRYQTVEIDITGMTHSEKVRQAVRALAGDAGNSPVIMRVVLVGQAEPELDLDLQSLLSGCAQHFRYLDPIVDRTEPPFDLEDMRQESTTRGKFVQIMEQRIRAASGPEAETLKKALHYGLQAFGGREIRRR